MKESIAFFSTSNTLQSVTDLEHPNGGIVCSNSGNKEEEIKYQWSAKFFPKNYVNIGGQTIEI